MEEYTIPARVVCGLDGCYVVLSLIALGFVFTVSFSTQKLFAEAVVQVEVYYVGLALFAVTLAVSSLGVCSLVYKKKTLWLMQTMLNLWLSSALVIAGSLVVVMISTTSSGGLADAYDLFLENYRDYFIQLSVSDEIVVRNEWFTIQEQFACCGVDVTSLLQLDEVNSGGNNLSQAEFNAFVLSGPGCTGIGTDESLVTTITTLLENSSEANEALEAFIDTLVADDDEFQFCLEVIEESLRESGTNIISYLCVTTVVAIIHLCFSWLLWRDESGFWLEAVKQKNDASMNLVPSKSRQEQLMNESGSMGSLPAYVRRVRTLSPGLKPRRASKLSSSSGGPLHQVNSADETGLSVLDTMEMNERDAPGQVMGLVDSDSASVLPKPPPKIKLSQIEQEFAGGIYSQGQGDVNRIPRKSGVDDKVVLDSLKLPGGSSFLDALEQPGDSAPAPISVMLAEPRKSRRQQQEQEQQKQKPQPKPKSRKKKLRMSQLEREFTVDSSMLEKTSIEPQKQEILSAPPTPPRPDYDEPPPPPNQLEIGEMEVMPPESQRSLRKVLLSLQKAGRQLNDADSDEESIPFGLQNFKLTLKREGELYDEKDLQGIRAQKTTMTAPPPFTNSMAGRQLSAVLQFVPGPPELEALRKLEAEIADEDGTEEPEDEVTKTADHLTDGVEKLDDDEAVKDETIDSTTETVNVRTSVVDDEPKLSRKGSGQQEQRLTDEQLDSVED